MSTVSPLWSSGLCSVTGRRGNGQLLSFSTPVLGEFNAVCKKALYQICVKVFNLRSLAGVRELRWTEFFGPDFAL